MASQAKVWFLTPPPIWSTASTGHLLTVAPPAPHISPCHLLSTTAGRLAVSFPLRDPADYDKPIKHQLVSQLSNWPCGDCPTGRRWHSNKENWVRCNYSSLYSLGSIYFWRFHNKYLWYISDCESFLSSASEGESLAAMMLTHTQKHCTTSPSPLFCACF